MNFITVEPDTMKSFLKSPLTLKRAADVLHIVQKMRRFWPVTVRSVYYKVISDERYSLDHWRSQKGKNKGGNLENPDEDIVTIIKYLRLSGQLSWLAINDDSRIVTIKLGHSDVKKHTKNAVFNSRLPSFSACNAVGQKNYIEVWVEKNGLVHIVESVADEFCRRVVGCKGFSSVSLLHQYSLRADRATEQGQNCKILYFGDLDTRGWLIPKTIASSLYYEHDTMVEVIRCGLNPYDIGPGMQSIPLKDTSLKLKKKFQDETGLDVAYELDLLDPENLQNRVRAAIMQYTDMKVFEKVKQSGQQEECKHREADMIYRKYTRKAWKKMKKIF